MLGLGRKDKPQPSGQQRRADANRRADRAGRRQIEGTRASRTSWVVEPAPKKWWRS